jgi:uncharacterized phage-associated protein
MGMAKVWFEFNPEKFIAASAYLSQRCPDMTKMKLFKLLFFADKQHLSNYARPIFGGRYIAMKDGPVPSEGYDIVKNDYHEFHRTIEVVERYKLRLLSAEDSALAKKLSRSDRRVLDEVASRLGRLSAKQLLDMSHTEPAWSRAELNAEMDYSVLLEAADPIVRQLVEEDQVVRDLIRDQSLDESLSQSFTA